LDRLTRSLKRRIEKLERELAAVPAPVQPEEMARQEARMMELCAAALGGPAPENLTQEERELLDQLREYESVVSELLEEGALEGYLDYHGDLHHGGLTDEDRGGER
jgi:uncharacterized alpha-E superfamily protein